MSRSRRRRSTSARARLRTFRSITLPLILPAVVSAFLIAFTTSFDEYAVASFVVGTRDDVPDLPLLGASLPEPASAGHRGRRRRDRRFARCRGPPELGRRVAERRLGALES